MSKNRRLFFQVVALIESLDGTHFLFATKTTATKNTFASETTAEQLGPATKTCFCMGSVLFSNMLKETHTVDYVGQSFQ